MTLTCEHLAEGVRDVDDTDVGGVDLGRSERAVDDLCGESCEVAILSGEVASEIGLVAAENPHACRAVHTRTVLRDDAGLSGRRCPRCLVLAEYPRWPSRPHPGLRCGTEGWCTAKSPDGGPVGSRAEPTGPW